MADEGMEWPKTSRGVQCHGHGQVNIARFSTNLCVSNGVDQGELAVFLEPLNLGKLCPEDLQELFEFLDVDKDGIISVQDFSTAVVIPMQEEQMERAIDTKELGGLFADALPLPQATDPRPRCVRCPVLTQPVLVSDR
eukprot:3937797-Rhodomonas_salina.4